MLETEKFEPPADFVKQALLNDPKVYEEAEKDWKGWWMKQAKELHWSARKARKRTSLAGNGDRQRAQGPPRR